MKTPNIDFMTGYVEDYLNGKMERWAFELDFDYYLMERYKKMRKEDRDFAEAFVFCVSENGVDVGRALPDAAFKKLIRRQFAELLDIARDGFC